MNMPAVPEAFSMSVVVPAYGCAKCLEQLCARLHQVLPAITPAFEIVLVDDRSPDGGWDVILRLREQYPAVKGVRLSRNFGQQIAITAGLSEAKGDYVVVMDCDLQDPPEKIPELYAKLREGHDLVLARRVERSHSKFRLMMARAYFFLMGKLTEERMEGSYGAFSLLSRKVVDAFLQFGERERHYLFILRWLGFNVGSIDFEHGERYAGRSAYTLGALVRHAIDGVFFQATVLLRWIVMAGLTLSVVGAGLAAYFVYRYFTHGSAPGFTSLAVLLLLCTGAILVSLGVIGLYVGKIFDQSKGRPLHVIDVVTPRRMSW